MEQVSQINTEYAKYDIEHEMEIETTKKETEPLLHNGHNTNSNGNHQGQDLRYRSDSLMLEFESPTFNMIRGQLGDIDPLTLNGENSQPQGRDFVLFKSNTKVVRID